MGVSAGVGVGVGMGVGVGFDMIVWRVYDMCVMCLHLAMSIQDR